MNQYQSGSSAKKYIVASAVLIIILIFVIIIVSSYLDSFSTSTPETPPYTESQADTGQITNTERPPAASAEEKFLVYLDDHFNSSSSWSSEELNTLKLKWLSLTVDQQSVIQSSERFKEFSQQLVAHIGTEQKQGNIVPTDYELVLITVAKSMGLMHLVPR